MTRRANMMRGFTLVEMMIALALGSLLAIVVAQLFANTRESNRATEDAARLQESMRYAAMVIGRTVRIAGYKSNPTNAGAIFPAAARALDGTNGALTASDTLIVRFQGAGPTTGTADSTVLNCLGVAVAPDFAGTATSYNRFSIATGADGRNALFCNTDTAAPLASGTELVPGVEAMQVIFGEDTTATPDGTADRFVPVGDVANLDNVVVVRVYLLLSGKENVRLNTATANYTVGGVAYSFTDQKIRRVVTQTIVLRNRAP